MPHWFVPCREDWVVGARIDATLVCSLHEAHEAVLTPGLSPAVLHLPVVVSAVSSIADEQHAVVGVGAALASDHTTCVVLEDVLICLDGNGNRLSLKRRLQVRILAPVQVLHASDCSRLQAN